MSHERCSRRARRSISSHNGSPPNPATSAEVASVAWRALPAWFCPPRHLHDRPARMRASLATALLSWCVLAGLGLVLDQLTQTQDLTMPGPAEVRTAFVVFHVTLVAWVLVVGLGGLPLWLLMLRRARREWRTRDTVYLLLPVLAPAAFLGAVIATGGAPELTVFAAAAIAAAGPGLALRRLQPQGPALRLAAAAGGVAAAIMAVGAAAIVVAAARLSPWPQPFAGNAPVPTVYMALVVTAATVTAVSAARGTRAALASHNGA